MPAVPRFKKNGFTFRQFFVAHDQCGMKVSTDGIILGAAAPLPDDGRVLDIGSGSGLISLMMAQRLCEQQRVAQIDAIELDPGAVRQSRENIAQSPWPDQIQVHHADILDWDTQGRQRYSVIVSNPPFFSPGVSCSSDSRETARYTRTLTHQALLQTVRRRITAEGRFCVILPADIGLAFISLAESEGWYLRASTEISEYQGRKPHRLMSEFSLTAGECTETPLIIRDPQGQYSVMYRMLTGNFYLPKSAE